MYLIGDAQQEDKLTNTAEEILNHNQGNFNKGNDVKESSK